MDTHDFSTVARHTETAIANSLHTLDKLQRTSNAVLEDLQLLHNVDQIGDYDVGREKEAIFLIREKLELLEDRMREFRCSSPHQLEVKHKALMKLHNARSALKVAVRDESPHIMHGGLFVSEVLEFCEALACDLTALKNVSFYCRQLDLRDGSDQVLSTLSLDTALLNVVDSSVCQAGFDLQIQLPVQFDGLSQNSGDITPDSSLCNFEHSSNRDQKGVDEDDLAHVLLSRPALLATLRQSEAGAQFHRSQSGGRASRMDWVIRNLQLQRELLCGQQGSNGNTGPSRSQVLYAPNKASSSGLPKPKRRHRGSFLLGIVNFSVRTALALCAIHLGHSQLQRLKKQVLPTVDKDWVLPEVALDDPGYIYAIPDINDARG